MAPSLRYSVHKVQYVRSPSAWAPRHYVVYRRSSAGLMAVGFVVDTSRPRVTRIARLCDNPDEWLAGVRETSHPKVVARAKRLVMHCEGNTAYYQAQRRARAAARRSRYRRRYLRLQQYNMGSPEREGTPSERA